MSKIIMVQGTMSSAGKTFLAAALCRIFAQDGFKVAPFKSQNMALNSYVTADGLEMGRAQVMQAEAAFAEPDAAMNPILLKPLGNTTSQVIVNGRAVGNMTAREYYDKKERFIPEIKAAFKKLAAKSDIIVIEGAGSPAEINLKDVDIVNMGLAKMLGAPVLLAGDIDRGGVFAQLIGTLALLEKDERELVKGLVINKFRGDKTILDPGIKMLEKMGSVPVCGVIPYADIRLDDEDSLSERFGEAAEGEVDIAVIRFPRISNFTDMNVFDEIEGVSVRYVRDAASLGKPDMVVLPGSKSVIDDLRWLRQSGLEARIKRLTGEIPVFGICGGLQMLGDEISDPDGVEGGGRLDGMGLLPVRTTLMKDKTLRQAGGRLGEIPGILSGLSNLEYEGYEIHAGKTELKDGEEPGILANSGNVYGTYIHSIFDKAGIAQAIAKALADLKGISLDTGIARDYSQVKQQSYDELADLVRGNLDMKAVYAMLREAAI